MKRFLATSVLLISVSAIADQVVEKGTEQWFNALDLAYSQSAECGAYSDQVQEIKNSYQSRMDAAKARSDWNEMSRLSKEMRDKMIPPSRKGTECAAKWLKENKGIVLEH